MSKSAASSGSGKKNRRKRTSITGELLECLEMFYRKNSRPDRCERRQLAVEIGKPENLVRIWFQNRRAKQRRESQLLLKQMVPTIIVEPHQHNGKTNSGGSKTLQTVLNNSNNNSNINNKLVDCNDSITVSGTTTKNAAESHQLKSLECSKCTEDNSCSEHHQSPSSSSLQSLRLASQDEGSSQEFTTDSYDIHSQTDDVVPFILDSKLYSHVLKRIVGMVAAAESVLDETDPDFAEAILDANYGILLKGQKKLLYDEVFGLHVVDSP